MPLGTHDKWQTVPDAANDLSGEKMRQPAKTHKFKIGQHLNFSPRRIGSAGGNVLCKVLKLLPQEDGQPQYRIKCSNENVERVVKEFALTREG
jgi:hypothetical protein